MLEERLHSTPESTERHKGALRQLEAERDLILALQTESAERHKVH